MNVRELPDEERRWVLSMMRAINDYARGYAARPKSPPKPDDIRQALVDKMQGQAHTPGGAPFQPIKKAKSYEWKPYPLWKPVEYSQNYLITAVYENRRFWCVAKYRRGNDGVLGWDRLPFSGCIVTHWKHIEDIPKGETS